MLRTLMSSAAVMIALTGALAAETFEVKMLNRGENGTMVFEPASLRVAVGDMVKFIAADRGHNAETADGMVPDGAEGFAGKINEEIEITLTEPGFYGVICKPHFAMGMVMVIAVGEDTTAPDSFLEGRIPRKAKQRFDDALSGL